MREKEGWKQKDRKRKGKWKMMGGKEAKWKENDRQMADERAEKRRK